MKKLIIALIILAVGYFALSVYQTSTPPPAYAIMCFNSGYRISGLNKICYYRCGNGTAAITVRSYELCPLTIED